MPIDYNNRLEEEEDTTVGTPSGIVSTGTAQTNPSTQGSGQFSNLQDYIKSSEGQRNTTASKVGQDVENRYNTAISGIKEDANQIEQNRNSFDAQRNQFNNIVSGAGTGTITPDQIASARNLAMGISSPDYSARDSASNLLAQSEMTKQQKANELKNIGSGALNIQDYLKGIKPNLSTSTRGELRLDEFLTRQTPEGSNQLQTAFSRGENLAANQDLQNAMGTVNSSIANLDRNTLSDYVKSNRGNYFNTLGDVNKQRASTLKMENRGITDLNQARNMYDTNLQNTISNDKDLKDYADAIQRGESDISKYNNEINQLNKTDFNESKDQALERKRNVLRSYGIQPVEANSIDSTDETALYNDAMRGLQSLRGKIGSETIGYRGKKDEREADLRSSIQSSDPYHKYLSDMSKSLTRQDALRANEQARLQALYSLSGEEEAYRNYLAGGL
jgi:hypothetical protein